MSESASEALGGFSYFWIVLIVSQAMICAALSSYVAKEKGYRADSWFVVGLLFGIFALVAVAGLPSERHGRVATPAMKIWKLPLKKDLLLKSFSEAECNLFFALGFLQNEIGALQKMLLLCSPLPGSKESKIEEGTRNFQALLMVRLLCGKLWEGWRLLETGYFAPQLSRTYEGDLTAPAKEALRRLKHYFKGQNLIKKVRNDYAFHFSIEGVHEQLQQLDEEVAIFLADSIGNSFYQASDILLGLAMFESIAPGQDRARTMGDLIGDGVNIADEFQRFIGGLLVALAKRRLNLDSEDLEEIKVCDVPQMNQVRIPYFLRR